MKSVPKPCVCSNIRKVSRLITKSYDNKLAEAGLNGTQLSILRAIERHPDDSMAQIANALSMDRTSFYRTLNPLKKNGWIIIVDKQSGPARTVTVTPKGQKILSKSAPLWEEMQSSIIDSFGRNSWRTLVSELDRLVACIPNDEENS